MYKVSMVSLGCPKNQVDAEIMLKKLVDAGYILVDEAEKADVVIVNTCAFIEDSKKESIDSILEMIDYKEDGNLKGVVVTGCLAQRYNKEIVDEIPEVDAVLGTTSYDKIVEAIDKALQGEVTIELNDIDALPKVDTKRIITTGGHFAYLKIAEGCNKHCTYCIIPKVRGSYRSIPMESLVTEAKTLVENGVKELILVAQETTMYGIDLYGKKVYTELVKFIREEQKFDSIDELKNQIAKDIDEIRSYFKK